MAKSISIAHGFDERYLRDILTKDITPAEAIYDLVDNAIDAARNQIIRGGRVERDRFGLPANYAGYKMDLSITAKAITLTDNSQGITENTLSHDAFVVGKPSHHAQGIGHFGVGLKRALLALGERYSLRTDTPHFAARMTFNAVELANTNEPLKAAVVNSRRPFGTKIKIEGIRPGPSHEFENDAKIAALLKKLSIRYGLFVRKGLVITLNGKPVSNFGPDIRVNGPLKKKSSHKEMGNVSVFIESGFHKRYRGTFEKDYDSKVISKLSSEYGWYFVCNDRIILDANTSSRLGFPGRWHPEYNGFVGWVHFVSDDPEDLPWDTKKSDIDANQEVFRKTKSKLEQHVADFRQENRKIKKKKEEEANQSDAGKGSDIDQKDAQGDVSGQEESGKGPADKKEHIKDLRYLLPSMKLAWQDKKLESLLIEAEDLPLHFPFACTAMLRMIAERAIIMHVKRSGKLGLVQERIFVQQEKDGRPFTDEQKENFEPTLRDFVDWLKGNRSYFQKEDRTDCHQALSKFASSLSKTINGAMHQSALVSENQIMTIRNEVFPLLQYLIETKPTKAE